MLALFCLQAGAASLIYSTPTLTKDPTDQLLTDNGTDYYLSFLLYVDDLDAGANRWQIRYSTNDSPNWKTNGSHYYTGTYEVESAWHTNIYHYQARVISSPSGDYSDWSSSLDVWAEMRPRNVYALATDTNTVTVTWDHVVLSEDGFLVQVGTNSGFTGTVEYINLPPTNAAVVPPIEASFQDTGFIPEVTYYYRIRATNSLLHTEWSNVSSVSPNSQPPLPFYFQPRNLTTGIKSTWQNGVGTVTYNYLQHSSGYTNGWTTIYAVTNTAGSYLYTHTGLTDGTTNYYRVAVSNQAGIRYTAPSLPVIDQYTTTSTNWYIDASATGDNRGTNWANAWPNFASIAWNSVKSNHTVWIAAGTYDETAYCDDRSGMSNYPIRFKVTQEVGKAGKVYLNYIYMDQNYIQWDGAASDAFTVTTTESITNNINLVLGSTNTSRCVYVNVNPAAGVKLKWIECRETQSPEWVQSVLGIYGESVTAGVVYQGSGPHFDNEIAYVWVHDLEGDGFGVSMFSASTNGFQSIDLHHCLVERVRGNFVSATGGDYHHLVLVDEWRPIADSPPGVHPDGMQLYGSYLRVYNNVIRNTTGQSIYLTLSRTNENNIFIYNNLIYSTGGTSWTNEDSSIGNKDVNAGIQFTTSHDNVAGIWDFMSLSNCLIANNTFYGFETSYLSVSRRDNQTLTFRMRDWVVANNLFFDISTTSQQSVSSNDYTTAQVVFDFNNVTGSNTVAGYGMGGAYSNYVDMAALEVGTGFTGNFSFKPAFVSVSYQAGRSFAYDFHLTTNDAANMVATNLSSWESLAPGISSTLDGYARSDWEPGAYGLPVASAITRSIRSGKQVMSGKVVTQ